MLISPKVTVQTQKWCVRIPLGTLKTVLHHNTLVEKVFPDIQGYWGEEGNDYSSRHAKIIMLFQWCSLKDKNWETIKS